MTRARFGYFFGIVTIEVVGLAFCLAVAGLVEWGFVARICAWACAANLIFFGFSALSTVPPKPKAAPAAPTSSAYFITGIAGEKIEAGDLVRMDAKTGKLTRLKTLEYPEKGVS